MSGKKMGPIRWVLDDDDLAALVSAIVTATEVVWDTETTGLDEQAVTGGATNGGVAARVSMATFTLPQGDGEDPISWVLPLSHPQSPFQGRWRDVLRDVAMCMAGAPEGAPIYDAVDADLYAGAWWRNTADGYVCRYPVESSAQREFLHHIIGERALGPAPEGMTIDHLNRDRLDNRRANLRYATRAEQMLNRESWGGSGHRGAYYHKRLDKYESAVTMDGKRHYLGVYETAEEASEVARKFVNANVPTGPRPVRRGKPKDQTAQNGKFDMKWVNATTGVDLTHLTIWDTMVSSHLLDETRSTSLKQRASEEFGIERWDDVRLDYPGASEKADIWQLGEYAARDTYWTWRLASKARYDMMLDHPEDAVEPEDIQLAKLGRVAKLVAMPTIASLAAIEQRGFLLDTPWVKDRLASEEAIAAKALDDMAAQYGQDRSAATSAATSLWFKAFTEQAIEAGDLRITALTDTGNPQWNKHVLRRQALKGSAVAQMILDQRGSSKKAEYLRSWLDHTAADGAVHTQYNAGRVVTGRLSSQEPNMQQVTKVLKPAFIPRPGNVIIDIDYSAIEMRVAAFISRCEPMMKAFREGRDPHRIMAGTMTGKHPDNVTVDERQGGKAGNFGLIFGMSAEGFLEYADDVYQVVMTMDEAVNARSAFFKTWKGIDTWHAKVQATVERHGYVTSPIGRVRRLPDVWSENHALANYARRQAINSPVQGFASDLMQIAAASIQGRLPVPGHPAVVGASIVGTVHDSIVLEAPENDWERVARECQERMTQRIIPVLERLDCYLDVPLAAEATVGTRWGLSDVGILA